MDRAAIYAFMSRQRYGEVSSTVNQWHSSVGSPELPRLHV